MGSLFIVHIALASSFFLQLFAVGFAFLGSTTRPNMNRKITFMAPLSLTISNRVQNYFDSFSAFVQKEEAGITTLSKSVISSVDNFVLKEEDQITDIVKTVIEVVEAPMMDLEEVVEEFEGVVGEELIDFTSNALGFIKRWTVPPTSPTDILSNTFSEALAGSVGALSSRLVAKLIGDEKSDNNLAESTTTGAYFAARSIVNNAARLAGIPRPVGNLLATIAGSFFSESTKVAGREIAVLAAQNKTSIEDFIKDIKVAVEVDEEVQLIESETKKKPLITLEEVSQDLTKWISYDLLTDWVGGDDVSVAEALLCGGLATLMGQAVYEVLALRKEQKRAQVKRAAAERTFVKIDDDGSKSISREEFLAAMLDMNPNVTEADVTKVFDFLDTDGSESIELEEFVLGISEPPKTSIKALAPNFLNAALEGAALFGCKEGTSEFFATNPLVGAGTLVQQLFRAKKYF